MPLAVASTDSAGDAGETVIPRVVGSDDSAPEEGNPLNDEMKSFIDSLREHYRVPGVSIGVIDGDDTHLFFILPFDLSTSQWNSQNTELKEKAYLKAREKVFPKVPSLPLPHSLSLDEYAGTYSHPGYREFTFSVAKPESDIPRRGGHFTGSPRCEGEERVGRFVRPGARQRRALHLLHEHACAVALGEDRT